MSCIALYGLCYENDVSPKKVPEPSGTFRNLLSLCCMQEHSRSFRKVPEPSGTFLVGNCIYGMSCIALYGLCYENDVSPKKVPEPSGTFRNLLSLCCMQEHSRSFRKVPEPSGTFLVGNCIYGMSCIALYGLCYENDVSPKKVPEPSGRFWNVHCIPHIFIPCYFIAF